MNDSLASWFAEGGISALAAQEQLLSLNADTSERGLFLTPSEAAELVETRSLALAGSGRIEIGGGAPEKIIRVFSHSEYLYPYNYAATLNELVEAFYFLKNDTESRMSDDDLIAFLFDLFENHYRGSSSLFDGQELEQLSRSLRYGWEEEKEEKDEENEDDGAADFPGSDFG